MGTSLPVTFLIPDRRPSLKRDKYQYGFGKCKRQYPPNLFGGRGVLAVTELLQASVDTLQRKRDERR